MDNDFSKIISDGLNAAQSSTELFLANKKISIFTMIRRELISLILHSISWILIVLSLAYLILFGVGSLLNHLEVESIYFGPVYASILMLFGFAYLASSIYVKSSSRLEVVHKAEKNLEASKEDLSHLKGSLVKWVKKYKLMLLVVVITYVLHSFWRTPKVSRKRRHKLKKQLLGLDNKGMMDDMKGVVVTVLLLLMKEFIEYISSSSVKPSRT